MKIAVQTEKINISVSELVFLTCRKRERFSKFDNALKDPSDFALSVVKREEEALGNNYYPDINLSCSLNLNGVSVELFGKTAISENHGEYTVDVVKSMRYPVKLANESFISDWLSEAKCLAFILANKRSLNKLTVRVCVFHTETLEKRIHSYEYSYAELEQFFKTALSGLSTYISIILPHTKERNHKNSEAKFPFPSVRDGQRDISKEVYASIKNKNNVIINAPTGLGKTMATLYPAIKAQSKGLCDKVFYLTAKNSGNTSVADAIRLFNESGYTLTVLYVSAKTRLCDKRPCSPRNCHYPQGHHDRVMTAVFEIASKHKIYTIDIISEAAQRHNVCPFILEMELSVFADLIVCDYNYVFDPVVSSKISSVFSGNDAILVDEAHNLIDRLRGINSAEIKLEKLKELADKLDKGCALNKAINGFLTFINDDTEDSGFACEPMSSQSLDSFEREINLLFSEFQEYFEAKEENLEINTFELLQLTESLKAFVDILTLRSSRYIAFYNDFGNPEIFMVDTSVHLLESSKKLGSLILFSATLFPEEYYKYMLGARKNDAYVSIPSPFDYHNLLVLGYPLSTKFSDREATIEDVVRAIYTAGRAKCGNYIAFFPSYQYMQLAVNVFTSMFPDQRVIYQSKTMNDTERDNFISSFTPNPTSTLYAFAVLGGVFSEGIDLVGEKLSGATVVGLGSLPPSRKSSLISQYFSDLFFDGEKFAYHYPGLNKVFQAGGRVIRSESDKGYLLIIDDRFLTEENIETLPSSWHNIKKVKDNNSIHENLCDFWKIE